MKKPNYNNYSVKELKEALFGIDGHSYPERVEELEILLKQRLRDHPEEVLIPSKYSGFGVRLVSYIADSFLFILLIFTAILIATSFEPFSYSLNNHPLYGVVTNFLAITYFVIYWTIAGKTPGKSLLGLVIVDEKTGAPPGLIRSFIRYLGYFISAAPLFLGFLWAIWHPRNRTWHDMLSGTVVVFEALHGNEKT